jgi:hypothetical protein
MGQREVLLQWEHRKFGVLWYKLRLLTFWLLAVVLPKIEKPAQARQANLWEAYLISPFIRLLFPSLASLFQLPVSFTR